ncbi:hypothetical protein [Streptomyces morookaense]|uniref:hypothetical protein n=1 Tax=Streptomyces morookaense TaxID=1970 RepID=UPI00167DD7CF|nr:hypothetical protein [Streptomyces morookaense]
MSRLGGEPVWLDEPQWSLSSRDAGPMTFLAQFRVPEGPAMAMAYLFMNMEGAYTWQPDGGQDALILMPDGRVPPWGRQAPVVNGPLLRGADGRAVCHEVRLTPGTVGEDYIQHIGRQPNWLQGDETPEGWTFLLQLDSMQLCDVVVNFGDLGVGYAFISPDRREGRFLWQSG